ncbi:MAG: heme NO-binding domain-containing protein, partial [Pirellulaceae bacterium]|nr:heme NO-binding domain-containing protein [Pirellulaceae bacterium]
MHGSICCIVKKFVETQFGKAAWDEILVTAGFEGLQLSPIGVYPDEAVIALLGAGCELLECELDDLLGKIGRFAGPELVSFASNMLHPDWKTFELLANVESLIHRT